MASEKKSSAETDTRERLVLRVHSKDKQRAAYWADARGYSSVNEYAAEALQEKIARESGDFQVPNVLILRLNELIGHVKALSVDVNGLGEITQKGLESLVGLTRGDSYLTEDEDGEL